jgi:hypothetical protein
MLWLCFRLKIDFNFQNVSCAPNFLFSQASATMDDVIYSAPSRPWVKSSIVLVARTCPEVIPVPILATMDEVIHGAPWRPGMKPSLVPHCQWPSCKRIGIPLLLRWENLSILQHCCCYIQVFSSVFNSLTDFALFVCMCCRRPDFGHQDVEETQYPQSKQLTLALHSRRFRSYPKTS